jgi:hypothetical protein
VPRQNRVTPFGTLIATPHRGTLMGNRGCLHDDEGVIRRRFVGRRWISCLLSFKDRRRTIMAPNRYTELFFLDEATALAAGHRPCVECQRARYQLFLTHWLAGQPGRAGATPARVDDVDRVLHVERLGDVAPVVESPRRLPAGVMVAEGDEAFLVVQDALRRWTPAGYERAEMVDRPLRVLTPPSLVRTIASGYPPTIHPSAEPSWAGPDQAARPLM